MMAQPNLPIVNMNMAESLKKLGFSEATPFCYKDGVLSDFEINRKDGMMRETAKCPTYNQALETGLRVAINFLGKKKRRRRKG